ncbi:MAG: hypothetical protein NXI30_14715 [bacterium]|nr:hypothetical protein [bacterium]
MTTLRIALAGLALFVAGIALAEDAPRPQITMGNGEKNWILVDGLERSGRTLTFREVHLDAGGWLVLHPFEGGKPKGDIYVGARYLAAGTHKDVSIDITTAPEPTAGTPFVAMLHSDVDGDETFDFVFVDGGPNVEDIAVFEGTTMVAHVVKVP